MAICVLVAALVAPRTVSAVQIPLVTVILPKGSARHQTIHGVFMQQFASFSPAVGKSKIYIQSPNSDVMSLRNSIRKAVAIGSDLIIVYGSRAAMAAKQEDFTEPLLFVDVFDPVSMGLVPAAGRGAPLVTGVAGSPPVQTLLRSLFETMGSVRLGVPLEPRNPAGKIVLDVLRKSVCRTGPQEGRKHPPGDEKQAGDACWLEVVPVDVPTLSGLQSSLRSSAGKFDVLYLSDLLPTDEHFAEAMSFAAANRIPVVTQVAGMAEKGALVDLEGDLVEQGELLAEMVRKVLLGDLPSDIPPAFPHKVSMTINMATAQQLGIQIPFPVLTQASRVVR